MSEKSAAAAGGLEAAGSPFSVQIGQLYDGPFDLLLDLIRRRNIDIADIPIAAITTEYLRYLENLRELEIEVAAEFLVVAATLIQIKSKLLLPADPVLPGEAPAEDPRAELVARLIAYEQYKQAASQLHQRQQLEAASWTRPGLRDWQGAEGTEPELTVGVYDLVNTLGQMLKRLAERPALAIKRDEVSVPDMMRWIQAQLAAVDQPLAVRPLFAQASSRSGLLAIFLAVLELVRLNVARLRQEQPFGEILLKRTPEFAAAWSRAEAGLHRQSPAHDSPGGNPA